MQLNVGTVVNAATVAIPIIMFIATGVAVFLFVRYKGTIDALKDAVNTYESLSEAYKQKAEQLQTEIDELKIQVRDLQATIGIQKEAIRIAVDETLDGLKRYGVCVHAGECLDYCPPQQVEYCDRETGDAPHFRK